MQTQNDPFSWGNETNNKKSTSNDFDFDFNAGKEKQTSKVDNNNIPNNIFDVQVSSPPKPIFDPFADNSAIGASNSNDLSGIKFDPPPQPVLPVINNTKLFEPEVKVEVKPVEKKLDPDELLSQKTLFNLSTLSKNKPAKVEIKSDSFGSKFGQSNTSTAGSGFSMAPSGSSFGDSSFASSFSAPANPPESKVDRLNALESCFGSSVAEPPAAPVQSFNTNFAAQKPKGNDFGEFPTMFGSTPGGFGSFQGFGNEGFGSIASNDFAFKVEEKPVPPPAQKKKDDWFEF